MYIFGFVLLFLFLLLVLGLFTIRWLMTPPVGMQQEQDSPLPLYQPGDLVLHSRQGVHDVSVFHIQDRTRCAAAYFYAGFLYKVVGSRLVLRQVALSVPECDLKREHADGSVFSNNVRYRPYSRD